MAAAIDLNRSVKDICSEYPEVIDILKSLGFDQITSPGMLNTVGRFMTIKKGAAMRDVDLEIIKQAFKDKGYEIKE